MHLRVAWLVGLLELRVEKTVRNRDFISSKLVSIWAVVTILVHPRGSIGAFMSPPFAKNVPITWTSLSFPTLVALILS